MHPLLNAIGFFILVFTVIVFFIFLIKFIIFLFKRNGFPRKTFISTIVGFTIFLAIFIYIQYFFTFNAINREHTQEGPEVSSPNGNYTANAYYEPYGGAAGGVNVWVEITNHIDQTTKIIYYAEANQNISMNWVDEVTLSITNAGGKGTANSSRSVVLNVETEIYHENGLACQSLLMKDEYETCYQHIYK